MIKIIKALLSGKMKTIIILVFTLFVTMFTIHVNQSLSGFDQELAYKIQENGGSQTTIELTANFYHNSSFYNELTNILNTFEKNGVTYTESNLFNHFREDVLQQINDQSLSTNKGTFDNLKKIVSSGSVTVYELDDITKKTHELLSGKPLEELKENEIAINKSMADILIAEGKDPFNYNADLAKDYHGESLGLMAYRVVSIIDTFSNSKYNQVNEEISNFSFFQNDASKSKIFVKEEDFQNIIKRRVDDYRDNRLALVDFDLLYKNGYDGEDFEVEDPTSWSQAHIMAIEQMNTENFKERFINKSYNLIYEEYSSELEDEIQKTINESELGKLNIGEQYFQVNTLNNSLEKAPLIRNLLETLSNYLVLGVLLTSFYSFYIYLKNQLRKSSHEISTLLIQGISWTRILMTYLLELGLIFSLSTLLIFITQSIFKNISNEVQIFSGSQFILFKTVGYTFLFILLVLLFVFIHLLPYRKKAFKTFKDGSKTRISWTGLSSNKFIKQMSLKRLFIYFASSLSLALNVALIVFMIILSLSASYHIRNVYNQDTFGIHFDYMILDDDLNNYYEVQKFTESHAIVEKENNITFFEHNLWDGNSNYYESSEITFYNDIKSFVNVEWGEYPPLPEDVFGEDKYGFVEAMVSRRHIDKRDAQLSDKKTTSNNVEDSYLFYYDNFDFYENAYEIKGTTNTLFNNGWTVYEFKLLDESPANLKDFSISEYIVNLNEDTIPAEFETFLKNNNIKYLSYDLLLKSFQSNNDAMNETSLNITLFVSSGMILLLLMNVMGIMESVRLEREKDDQLLLHIGVTKINLSRINLSVLLLRMLLSLLSLSIIYILFYSRFFNDILGAFGLFSMPGSITPIFTLAVTISIVILIIFYILVSRIKKIVSN